MLAQLKTLSVSVADITEYPTINIRSWYDDATLASCTDNVLVDGSLICGIRTPELLASKCLPHNCGKTKSLKVVMLV